MNVGGAAMGVRASCARAYADSSHGEVVRVRECRQAPALGRDMCVSLHARSAHLHNFVAGLKKRLQAWPLQYWLGSHQDTLRACVRHMCIFARVHGCQRGSSWCGMRIKVNAGAVWACALDCQFQSGAG